MTIVNNIEAAEKRIAELEAAIDGVLHFRVGKLPNQGWLRDNDQSRAALAKLDRVRSALARETPDAS